MAFVDINGCVHHYVVEGGPQKPALLFSNSLGSDLRMWDALVPFLAGDFRLIRYDTRGHGLSEAPPAPYRMGDLARDAAGLLDRLQIESAVICGLSVGGVIAQQLAIDYPSRVRALVLCDTGTRIGTVMSWDERISIVRQKGMGALVELSMARWFTEDFRLRQSDQVRGFASMVARTSPDGYIGVCCALRDADLSEASAAIKKPTLVLCGEQDIATPPEMSRQLASVIPHTRLSIVPGAAHISCVEQPEVMADQMMQFFREVQIV
jgi:3-oxoadipate enol-lactonase